MGAATTSLTLSAPKLNLFDNMKTFVNLTPHTVRLNDGTEYPASGVVARVATSFSTFDADGVARVVYGEPEGLPAPQEGVLYIVSAMVLAAVAGTRSDLVAPATGHPDTVRVEGRIQSVPGFVR